MNYPVSFMMLCCILAVAIDIKTKCIPNWLNGALWLVGLIACLLAGEWLYIILSLLVLILLSVSAIGGGDKKMVAAIALYFREDTALFLFWFSVIYLLYVMSKKQECEPRPLAPAIVTAVILTLLCC